MRRHAGANASSTAPDLPDPGNDGLSTRGVLGGSKGSSAPKARRAPVAFGAAMVLALVISLGAAQALADAPPLLTIEPATAVSYTSAHFKGTVDPNGGPSSSFWHFEYSTDEASWNQFNGDQEVVGSEPGPVNVQDTATGLAPNTKYFVRLVATNEDGAQTATTDPPSEVTFTTKEVAKPTATIEAPTAITATTAHFSGHVNPNAPGAAPQDPAFDTQWSFTCSPACGFSGSSSGTVPADNKATAVQADASGLQANTNYTVTLHATNAGGENVPVAQASFKTATSGPNVSYLFPTSSNEVTATTARTLAFVNLNNSDLLGCHFEYGTSTAYGKSAPCQGFNETQEVTVDATAGQFRLSFEGDESADLAFDASPAAVQGALEALPSIGAGNVSVEDGAASPSSYVIEFQGSLGAKDVGELSAKDGTTPLSGGAGASVTTTHQGIATSGQAIPVSAVLSGLTPNTTYHFRIVVSNTVDTAEGDDRTLKTFPLAPPPSACPNEAIRAQQHAGLLPGCRAWEMVSPLDKNGGNIAMEGWNAQVSANGDKVLMISRGSFGDTEGSGVVGVTTYMASRNPGGWTTHGLTPTPALESLQIGIVPGNTVIPYLSEDFSSALVSAYDLAKPTDDIPRDVNIYWEDTRTNSLQTITKSQADSPPLLAFAQTLPHGLGVSATEGLVAFTSKTRLLPEAPLGKPSVYEWQGGTLKLSGILPDGKVAAEGSTQPEMGVYRGTVSNDGSLVVFLSPKEGNDQLYLRRNHTSTAWVSEPEGSTPVTSPTGVEFQYITPDNHHVLFTTSSRLLDEDTNDGPDLYLYTDGPNPASEDNLTLISDGSESGDMGVGSHHILGTSKDGARVYFYPRESTGIYLWEAGSSRLIIAPDTSAPPDEDLGLTAEPGLARVSADGERLALISKYIDVGYETGEHREAYLYDAPSKTLACASCPAFGQPATGDVSDRPAATAAGIGVGLPVRPRFLSSDGNAFFFATPEALVPEDTNGVMDTYEYNAQTGKRSLISSGRGEAGTWFADASPDGSNVVMATQQQLVGADGDELVDLYDAKVNGGFLEPPPPPTPCAGDGCRGPLSLPPQGASPASAQFSGPGNPKAKHRKHQRHRKHRRVHRKHGKHSKSVHGVAR